MQVRAVLGRGDQIRSLELLADLVEARAPSEARALREEARKRRQFLM